MSKDPLTFVQIKAMVGRDDPVIIDAGSNDGTHTNRFIKTFPQASVYSFEPDPRAIAKWKQNVIDPRATLIESALGAVSGEATFHVSSGQRPGWEDDPSYVLGWDQSGSLRAPKNHLEASPWVEFEKQIRVKVITLDEWAADYGIDRIDFIWADVQGSESDLIDGGRGVMKRTRYFYTEYSNKELYDGQITLDAITELLTDDFEMVAYWRDDVLFKNTLLAFSHLFSNTR